MKTFVQHVDDLKQWFEPKLIDLITQPDFSFCVIHQPPVPPIRAVQGYGEDTGRVTVSVALLALIVTREETHQVLPVNVTNEHLEVLLRHSQLRLKFSPNDPSKSDWFAIDGLTREEFDYIRMS